LSEARGRHVTLVVPGLLGSAMAAQIESAQAARLWCEGLALPSLERFFSRSRPLAQLASEPGLAALLFACFGVSRQGSDWPVAAVTRRLDGAADDALWWLRADPVHLRAGLGDLSLLDGAALRISMAEAEALSAEINAELGESGVQLEAPAPGRWYLGFHEPPDLVTEAPWEVSGAGIGAHLPRGADAGHWQARINTVQMILHASAVNRAREGRGVPPINSLWLWGGGRTPRVAPGSWRAAWADQDVVAGLAALAKVGAGALPANARAWLPLAEAPGDYLLVWCPAYAAARRRDVDTWRRLVSEFDKVWMAPLLEALEAGRVDSLSVRGAGGRDSLLGRRQLGYWWRTTKPLSRFMFEDSRGRDQKR
jgi:hypothetical protein